VLSVSRHATKLAIFAAPSPSFTAARKFLPVLGANATIDIPTEYGWLVTHIQSKTFKTMTSSSMSKDHITEHKVWKPKFMN
jgi:hypothetical protein